MASAAAGAGGAGAAGGMAIDEDLYSRQLDVLGHDAMNRMTSSNVLVVGLTGTGAELVKNIVLMGVKSVALFDPSPAEWRDLSAHFYLTPEDVGKPRAASCVAKLAALNEYVAVSPRVRRRAAGGSCRGAVWRGGHVACGLKSGKISGGF